GCRPRFFLRLESWQQDAGSGFHVRHGARPAIWGRFENGAECFLQWDPSDHTAVFKSGGFEVEVDAREHRPLALRGAPAGSEGAVLAMARYHVLRTLLESIVDPRRVDWGNAAGT